MKTSMPGSRSRLLLQLAAALFALVFASVLQAQPTDADPPARVGRVAETFGRVWLWSPDIDEWIEAVRNRPVTSGDRIATDRDARVEVDVGSTTLRLDGDTELEVLNLDDTQVVLQLHQGSVATRVRDASAVGEFELDTEEGRVRVQAAGRYRFDRRDGSTHLTVYTGQAYFEGPGSALTLLAGQRGQFWIQHGGIAQYSITDPVNDAFASWSAARDRDEDRLAASARYVSPEMTGARDLDRWGRWEQTPEYGPIWIPSAVPSGWAPYSTGHWAWVAPWGWTWVDEAPWGFAPFHYGRWVYYRSGWCWTPGAYVRRPVYAPALVAWIGGPRASVSLTIGGGPAVGWFPLGPREVYVPYYRSSPRYVRELNINHVTNVTVINRVVANPDPTHREFVNRRYPRAVTVVPQSVLTQREPVAPHAVRGSELRPAQATLPAATLLMPPVGAPPHARAEPGGVRPGGPAFGARPERPGQRAAEEPMRRIPERNAPPFVARTAPAGDGALDRSAAPGAGSRFPPGGGREMPPGFERGRARDGNGREQHLVEGVRPADGNPVGGPPRGAPPRQGPQSVTTQRTPPNPAPFSPAVPSPPPQGTPAARAAVPPPATTPAPRAAGGGARERHESAPNRSVARQDGDIPGSVPSRDSQRPGAITPP